MQSFKSFIREQDEDTRKGKKVSVGKSNVILNPNSEELKEETPVERLDRIAKEKVAQRAAASKVEQDKRDASAAAFQAHKKDVLAKGGRPVDALDSWQKKKMQDAKESAVPGKPAERLGAVTAIPQSERDAARERLLAKTKGIRDKKMKESKWYDPMKDPEFDHDEAERTRGQSGKNTKKKDKVKKEVEEGLDMKTFKANRKKAQRAAATADARKRGHEGSEWHNSGRTYSPYEAKRRRANMTDQERSERHGVARDPDSPEGYGASKTKNPKKQRKQAAMGEAMTFSDFMEARRMDKEGVDRGDTGRAERADKAKASLAKAQKQKKIFQSHHDKETAAGRTPRLSRDTPTMPEREHKKNHPGSRQAPKERGAKETPLETHNRRVNRQVARVIKHGHTSKEKKEAEAMAKHTSRFD